MTAAVLCRPSDTALRIREDELNPVTAALAAFVTDDNRTEPLFWARCPMSHLLTASFTVAEPRHDVARVQLWATAATANAQFMVSAFEAVRPLQRFRLTADARKMLQTQNAGGNSALSEAVALDVLQMSFAAKLDRTEMSIQYWDRSKITDFSVVLAGVRIGVSVTRACRFRGKFTLGDAEHLLKRKLFGILDSTEHVITPHQWRRQVLLIWAQRPAVADLLSVAWASLPVQLRADTLVLVVVAHRDEWIFFGDQNAIA